LEWNCNKGPPALSAVVLSIETSKALAVGRSGPAYGRIGAAFRGSTLFAGLVCLLVPYTLLCVLMLPWRVWRIRLGNRVGATAGRWAMWLAGITYEVVGESLKDSVPAIYVMNHGGSGDLWLAMRLCPVPGSGTIKKKVLRVPVIGQAWYLSGHLTLDRGNSARAIAAMDVMTTLVRKHLISVWILPEGTRSKDGKLQEFKKGFAHLALQTRLPVVPVVVHGVHDCWPRGTTVRPGHVRVEVLPAISTESWTRETLDEHVAQVHGLFAERLP
jgi:1-acyl-sn-glycerol-3-phosphate acyltransferase